MAGSVQTTTPGMHAAAGHMGDTQSSTVAGVQSVRGALDGLRASWRGSASTKFDQSMNAWMSDCDFIIRKLGEMIEVMNGNRQVITSGEENNTQMAGNIPVGPGLGGL